MTLIGMFGMLLFTVVALEVNFKNRRKNMQTNQEKLNELKKQKQELEKQLKNIEKDIALYKDYTKQLDDYKQQVIKEQLLDVYNQLNSNDIQIKLTKSPDYFQIYLNKSDQTKNDKFVYAYSLATYTIESESNFMELKQRFDNDVADIKSYLENLSKTFIVLNECFPTYNHLLNIKITKSAIQNGNFIFRYSEGFHTKHVVKLNFSDNENLKYTMTKYSEGYSFEQNPKPNHHIKLKSESYENKINIEYSIENECAFDDLKESLDNTFKEIEKEFKDFTIEID